MQILEESLKNMTKNLLSYNSWCSNHRAGNQSYIIKKEELMLDYKNIYTTKPDDNISTSVIKRQTSIEVSHHH